MARAGCSYCILVFQIKLIQIKINVCTTSKLKLYQRDLHHYNIYPMFIYINLKINQKK